jgi:ELWxxDGT repeat protein
MIKNIDPGLGEDSYPADFEKLPGDGLQPDKLLFTAQDDGFLSHGIWETDGSAGNTQPVKTIPAFDLTEVGGTIYFEGFDGPQNTTPGTHSQELWKTDGTEAGTVLVKDINVGFGSSPQLFTDLNGMLYFNADDGIHGRELWRSDGTEAGTVLAADIDPGPGSGGPTVLTTTGSLIFFTANDGQHGREVWRAPAETTPPETTIDSGPANGATTSEATATFTFSSSEAGSTFECRTDGGGFSACTSPQTVDPLDVGQHTFEVRATDVVGNTDPTPASRTFTREATSTPPPPETTIPRPPGLTADTKQPEVTLKARKRQKLGKAVKLKATCDEDCAVKVKATVKLKGEASAAAKRGQKLKLKTARAQLVAGEAEKLKLKPKKQAKRKLKAARRATVKIRVVATDAAGNKSRPKAKVKLR